MNKLMSGVGHSSLASPPVRDPAMSLCLVALDEGPDITVDRPMLVVGRHPQCNARIDSIRISRRHCCMSIVDGELMVQDLGSTNGIRINGQRIEEGLLRVGDELSIAHLRYRLQAGSSPELTVADPSLLASPARSPIETGAAVADAIRGVLPPSLMDRCDIQVIVRPRGVGTAPPSGPREPESGCRSDLSH
jgi:hypothetical protein